MLFCAKCGSYARKVWIDPNAKTKRAIACGICGYVATIPEVSQHAQVVTVAPDPCPLRSSQEKSVISYSESKPHEPTVEHICPYCGCREAVLKLNEVRRGDEDALEIYRCTNCHKSSREGWGY